jgi:hypothetical protein
MGKEPDVDDPACILGGREREREGAAVGGVSLTNFAILVLHILAH